MIGVPAATNPDEQRRVTEGFDAVAAAPVPQDYTFKVDFESYSRKRADVSWLRAAYLAFFATLGYRFIFRAELDAIRAKILDPERDEPRTFRLVRSESVRPMLVRIDEPHVLRSYAMCYGRNVIFLPRYNDRDLYTRLGQHPQGHVLASVKEYPWPSSGPTFFHDTE